MTREEVKKRVHEKKVKRALKCLRFRKLKNFLFWLMGVIVMPVILVFTMFVGLKVVPISTYLGGAEKEYVSEDIASLSILDAILGFQDYTFDDVPYIETLLDDLMEQDLGGGMKLGSIIKIDTAKFSGHKITEIATVFSENVIEVVATLDGVIGVETLGDFGTLSIFSTWAEVSAEDYPADEITYEIKEGFNANLYYMKNPDYVEGGEEKEYIHAFEQDGDGEDATYNLFDEAKGQTLYQANLAQIPILEAVDLIDESMSSLMLNDILTSLVFKDDGEGSGEGESDNLILKIFDGWGIDDLGKMSDASGLLNNITIDDLGGVEMLGAFGELEIFNGYADVPVDDYPVVESGVIVDTEKHDPKLYYYNSGTGSLVRAFNDDGSLIDELGGVAPSKYYYPNLSRVGFTDALNMIDDCIGGMQVKGLLTALGNVTFEAGSLMDHVLGGDMLVSELGTIGTESNPIYLNWAMPYDPTSDICKIILDASECGYDESDNSINKANYDKITLNDLSKLNIDGLGLSTFVTLDSSTENILISGINGNRQAKAKADSDYVYVEVVPGGLTIGDFADFSADYIALSSVISSPSATLRAIFDEMFGDFDTVTVSQLGSFSLDNLKISTVLKDSENSLLISIFDQVYADDGGYANVKVSQLGSFSLDKVLLSTVMPSANARLQSILSGALNGKDYTLITIGDLSNPDVSGFDINKVPLTTVITYDNNPSSATYNGKLFDILLLATGNKGASVDSLTIGSLSAGFNLDGVQLTTVIEGSADPMAADYNLLLDILVQASPSATSADDLTIANLNNIQFTNVKLSTVMGSTDNVILNALIEKDVTIGSIGSAIDQLTLYEIYGKNCFVDIVHDGLDGVLSDSPLFKAVKDADGNIIEFAHITDAEAEDLGEDEAIYEIHANDGLWLLLCFDSVDFEDMVGNNPLTPETEEKYDSDGRPERYVVSTMTLGDLKTATSISSKFTNATVRQFIDAGLITETSGTYSNLYTFTLLELLNVANGAIN